MGENTKQPMGGIWTARGDRSVWSRARGWCVKSMVQSRQRHKWPPTSRNSMEGQSGPWPYCHHCLYQTNRIMGGLPVDCPIHQLTDWVVPQEGYQPHQTTAAFYELTRGGYNNYPERGHGHSPPVQAVWYIFTPGDTGSRKTPHRNVQVGVGEKRRCLAVNSARVAAGTEFWAC